MSRVVVIDPGTANIRVGEAHQAVPTIHKGAITSTDESSPSRKGTVVPAQFLRANSVSSSDAETIAVINLPIYGAKQMRESYAETLIEELGFKGIAFCVGLAEAMRSMGHSNGVAVDIGESGTDICVIDDGAVSSRSCSSPRAGRMVTRMLEHLLYQRHKLEVNYADCQALKERYAFVSQDLTADAASPWCLQEGRCAALLKSYEGFQLDPRSLVRRLPRELWPDICHYASCYATSYENKRLEFELAQCVECTLFPRKPNLDTTEEMLPLPDAILSSLRALPAEKSTNISQNIILTGGGSLLPGLVERLYSELSSSFPVRISRSRESALYFNWQGAAFFAKQPNFETKCVISRAEYAEGGTFSLYK